VVNDDAVTVSFFKDFRFKPRVDVKVDGNHSPRGETEELVGIGFRANPFGQTLLMPNSVGFVPVTELFVGHMVNGLVVENSQPSLSVRQSFAHLLSPLHGQDDRQNLATVDTKGKAPEGACFTGCRLPLQQQPSGAGGVGVPGFAQFLRSPAVCLICSEFASALSARFLFGWVAVLAKPAPHPRLFPL